VQTRTLKLAAKILTLLVALFTIDALPSAFAQSSQVEAEWGLFTQILYIGIAVGIVVFGLMFYAIIRYREKPKKAVV
jgi:heme/copper-type cytochrome/quinol oxidase subunit 2